MSDHDDSTSEQSVDSDESTSRKTKAPSPLRKRWVQILLLAVGALLLVAICIWLFHWWTRGRFVQTTNDAYMQADEVLVTSKISGTIDQIFVTDNERVSQGQPLAQIDNSASRARVEQAQAQGEQAAADISRYRAEMNEQKAAISQSQAQVQSALVKLRYESGEVDRYQPLAASGAEKPEKLAQLISDRDQALAMLHQNENAALQAQRKLVTLSTQIAQSEAKVREAEAQARQASVEVDSSLLVASIAGRVGDRAARVGQYVQSGTRLLTVVPVESMYVVANFKETQIGLMRVGQPATINVDALHGRELHGTVQSFSPGTGAQFAVIPATNATGNFTKIVQRVPVRLQIEVGPEARRVLVPGLSVEVAVDTVNSKDAIARQKQESDDAKKVNQQRDQGRDRNQSTSTSGAGR